ncbi:MAG: bacterial Ig-like domain-containing protein [Bacilli bacterium]|nr:bacterial Ig-like domain-containing protein [Bacilli bacterium]
MKTKYLLPIILSTLTIVSCGSSSKEETKPGGEGEIGNPIQSIDILHNPTKTEYIVGDFFEPDGLILTATYMDQKTSSISYDSNKQYFTFSIGLDTPLTLEDTTVTITYMSMTADISITVVEESEPEEETETYIVDFNSFVFSGSSKELSTSSKASTFEKGVTDFFDKQTEISGLLTSFSATSYVGIKKIEFDEETGLEGFNALQISSGSTSGNITFNFSKKLISVKVTAQAYYNAYLDNWSADEPFVSYSNSSDDITFLINNEEWELPEAKYDEETYQYSMPEKVSREFDINGNSLTIADDENCGRIFVHQLELTFEK